MTQVFISYSRKDLAFVEKLARDLRRAGFEVWYDISNLELGTNWGREIQSALENSQFLIVVLSPNSLQSRWVEREYLFAENQGLKIIPLLYKPCKLPLWTVDMHHIDMTTGNYRRHLEDLLKDMGRPGKATVATEPEKGRGIPVAVATPTPIVEPTPAKQEPVKVKTTPAPEPVKVVTTPAPEPVKAVTTPALEPVEVVTSPAPEPVKVVRTPAPEPEKVVKATALEPVKEKTKPAPEPVKPKPTREPQPATAERASRAPLKVPWKFLIPAVGVIGLAVVALLGFTGRLGDFRPGALAAAENEPTELSTVTLAATAGPTSTPIPAGMAWTSPVDGMTLVYVPAGIFTRGDDQTERIDFPRQKVNLDAFWIDSTEITNRMYQACVEDGACTAPVNMGSATRTDYYGSPEFEDYPVIYVTWDMATTYCQWAGRRLPTEAEWEKAARGTDFRYHPCGILGQGESNSDGRFEDTTEAGTFTDCRSPYGAQDQGGNVWEWVADWYSKDYYGSLGPNPANPPGPSSGTQRVIRGGSWKSVDLRFSPVRSFREPGVANDEIGFRCAVSSTDG